MAALSENEPLLADDGLQKSADFFDETIPPVLENSTEPVRKSKRNCLLYSLASTFLIVLFFGGAGMFSYQVAIPNEIKQRVANYPIPKIQHIDVYSMDNTSVSSRAHVLLHVDFPSGVDKVAFNLKLCSTTWNISTYEWPNGTQMISPLRIASLELSDIFVIPVEPLPLDVTAVVKDISPEYVHSWLNLNTSNNSHSISIRMNSSPRVEMFDGRLYWNSVDLDLWVNRTIEVKPINASIFNISVEWLKGSPKVGTFAESVDRFVSRYSSEENPDNENSWWFSKGISLMAHFHNPTVLEMSASLNVSAKILFEDVEIATVYLENLNLTCCQPGRQNHQLIRIENAHTSKAFQKLIYLGTLYIRNKPIPIVVQDIHVNTTDTEPQWLSKIMTNLSLPIVIPPRSVLSSILEM